MLMVMSNVEFNASGPVCKCVRMLMVMSNVGFDVSGPVILTYLLSTLQRVCVSGSSELRVLFRPVLVSANSFI